jgi:hypothetical protein
MGLRSDVQTDVAAAFDTDLSDAVVSFTLRHYTRGGGYDPVTRKTTTRTYTDYTTRGVFDMAKQDEILDSSVEPYAANVIILQNEIEVEPAIGDDIILSGSTDYYRISIFEQDPAFATYTVKATRVSP